MCVGGRAQNLKNIIHGWPTDGIGNRAKNPNPNPLERREDEKGDGCFLTTAAAATDGSSESPLCKFCRCFESIPRHLCTMRAERQNGEHCHSALSVARSTHLQMTGFTDDGGWDGSTVQFAVLINLPPTFCDSRHKDGCDVADCKERAI